MFDSIIFKLQYYLIGILIIIITYNLLIYFWNRRYLYYYSSKMNGPFNWPLLGYSWKFILITNQDIFSVILNFLERYKTPSAVWIGLQLYFVISDPKHYEIVLNSSKSLDKLSIYEFIRPSLGDGLLTASANKWKRHRKLIQPTFNQKILNNFVEIFSKQSKILVKDLDEYVGKNVFDVFPLFSKLTMTMVCHTLLGYEVLSKDQISNCFTWLNTTMDLIYGRIFKPWCYPDVLWNLTPSSKTLNENSSKLLDHIKQIVIRKRNIHKLKQKESTNENVYDQEDDTKRKAFLDYAIETLDENGQLTNEEIVEETAILLTAGTDTTAATNSFLMLMLALHPNIQNKVFDELYSIFGDDSDRPAEVEDLNKMVYLERVIKETMRLCPGAPFIGRKLDEDVHLESHILPRGSSCVLAFYETHRNPKIWENPLEFNPDRFLPEEVAKRHAYAFIPFSGGPRNCIGIKYAMMAIKVVSSTILRTYKVTTTYEKFSDVQFTHSIVLRCSGGCNVAFEYRK